MVRKSLSAAEIVELGERVYRDRLRGAVEAQHRNRFLVLDVLTGDYEIDDRDAEASRRLLQRHPDGQFYGVRIGHDVAYRLGVGGAGKS